MARPKTPRLSPITRHELGATRMIPVDLLMEQVAEMDRLGTWHLAQALAMQEGFDNQTVEENRYGVNKFNRHMQLAGALLGSINSRISTFRFLREVANGEHGQPGDREGYGKPR